MRIIIASTIMAGLIALSATGCDSNDQAAGLSSSESTLSDNRSDLTNKTEKSPWPYLDENTDSAFGFDQMLRQNFYVVFDGSWSMNSVGCSDGARKMDSAKKALKEFAQIVPPDANLGLIAFDENGIVELVELGEADRQYFIEKVNSVSAGGSTPLNTTIEKAYTRLTERARRQLGYGEYHLIIVTDGEASYGESPNGTVNDILSESPVIIHTVGFCINSRHSLNQPGRTLYRSANDYDSLRRGLAGVLAEAPDFAVSDFN